ncbi:tautomerase family protein [Erwinia sp. QL-Z3]|uniref:tautomerase family protein n=1 Tax=Erwinia sp. QL-Z3 TaxID=2547962 RepID=UPI001070B61F|nr:tautomerase family protein [Erwinia sp. QL-Z3]QBR49170.1 tautomerase family protein [Erwinia sp. QL-Z3]
MPLLQFDVIQGRSESEMRTLLDAAHRAVLAAFKVPARDRYQIVHENKAYQMVFEDTGLGLTRTDNLVLVRVFTSPRSDEQKQFFMAELCRELKESCGILGSDVMISFITNGKGDWSFGNGVAQYMTGDL